MVTLLGRNHRQDQAGWSSSIVEDRISGLYDFGHLKNLGKFACRCRPRNVAVEGNFVPHCHGTFFSMTILRFSTLPIIRFRAASLLVAMVLFASTPVRSSPRPEGQ
jgi:hypothetical protein